MYSLLCIFLVALSTNNAHAQTMKDAWSKFLSGESSELLVQCGKEYFKIKSGFFYDSVYILRDEKFVDIGSSNFTDTSVYLIIEYETITNDNYSREFDLLVDGTAAFFNAAANEARKKGKIIVIDKYPKVNTYLSHGYQIFVKPGYETFFKKIDARRYRDVRDYVSDNKIFSFFIKYKIDFFGGYLHKNYQRSSDISLHDAIYVHISSISEDRHSGSPGVIWDLMNPEFSDLISILIPKDYPKVSCHVEYAK